MGFSGTTPISRMLDGELAFDGTFGSRLPRHVETRGLREYIVVERLLNRLKPHYRATLEVEHITSVSDVGRTAVKRAAHLGVTPDAYRSRLRQFRRYLQECLDSPEVLS